MRHLIQKICFCLFLFRFSCIGNKEQPIVKLPGGNKTEIIRLGSSSPSQTLTFFMLCLNYMPRRTYVLSSDSLVPYTNSKPQKK